MGLETGIHTEKYQDPEAPIMVAGLSRVEGWGDNRARAPPGALTVAEGRDAESWLQITAGRVNMRPSADTKLVGLSDRTDGDDQEELKLEPERTGQRAPSTVSTLHSDYYPLLDEASKAKLSDTHEEGEWREPLFLPPC